MDLETWKLFTECVKICGAAVAFTVGIYQYVRTQKWKRREFIAAQFKDFETDERVRAVLTILDWSDRKIAFPSEIMDKPVVFVVREALLCVALLPQSPPTGYSTQEAIVRDCFDRFLDGLVRFQNFISAGLISVEELRPYMTYWSRSVSGQTQQHTPQFYTLLHNYIQIYGFTGAAQLITSLGYPVTVSKTVTDAAIQSALDQRSSN